MQLSWTLVLISVGFVGGKVAKFELFKKYDRVARLMSTGEWARLPRTNSSEPLVDYFDDYYNLNVSIGTPPQIISLAVDTLSSATWVIDSACYSDYCVGWTITDYDKNQYFTFNTTTYQNDSRAFHVKYPNNDEAKGWVASDVFSFAGFTVQRQEFGLAESVSRSVGLRPIDGYFGMGWPANDVDNMKPPIWSITDQMDEQLFTIWLDRHPQISYGSSGGQLTIGSLDTLNCEPNYNWVPLNKENEWEFKLDSFSMKDFTDSKTVAAISDTGRGWLAVPYWVMNKIEKFTDASYDFADDVYEVHCNRTGLPDMIFRIGGTEYHIPQSEYILDLGRRNGMCVIAAHEIAGESWTPTWILGDTFVRSYCQAYDMKNKRVGFSKAHHTNI